MTKIEPPARLYLAHISTHMQTYAHICTHMYAYACICMYWDRPPGLGWAKGSGGVGEQ